ncbi:MAG: tryptophan--tRNA ligase [Chloroflexi bacterium]|nr:tryptophan--tRNA ligase [Chloroflexota bacterium]
MEAAVEIQSAVSSPQSAIKKGRILTGDRPTGPLHLGHYVGTLANRVRLQDEYEVFLLAADYHALTRTVDKEHVAATVGYTRQLVLDYLSVGIDPDKTTIYVQSDVPSVCELHLLFSMLATVPRLERVPTLKEVMDAEHIEQPSYGLLGYPVLQASDILHVRANLVPVGKDQASHLEVTREIARRFNYLYGSEVFPEPDTLIGDVPTLVGTDNKAKMSKSLGNAIMLSDDEATVRQKVMSMYTDPTRIRADIPGNPDGNPVFQYHDAFNPNTAEVEDLKDRYRTGKVGDVEVKKKLNIALQNFLAPIRERRAHYEAKPGLIDEIIAAGAAKIRPISEETVAMAREAMGLRRLR